MLPDNEGMVERNGLHLHVPEDATTCKDCTNGPIDVLRLAKLRQKVAEYDGGKKGAPKAIRDELGVVELKVRKFKRHERQLEVQRAAVKNLESNLAEDEGILFRNFVRSYAQDGTKIVNLVFVFIERKNGALLWTMDDKYPLHQWRAEAIL